MCDDNLVRKRYGTARRCQVLYGALRAKKHFKNCHNFNDKPRRLFLLLFRVRKRDFYQVKNAV